MPEVKCAGVLSEWRMEAWSHPKEPNAFRTLLGIIDERTIDAYRADRQMRRYQNRANLQSRPSGRLRPAVQPAYKGPTKRVFQRLRYCDRQRALSALSLRRRQGRTPESFASFLTSLNFAFVKRWRVAFEMLQSSRGRAPTCLTCALWCDENGA